jgi:adenylate kinase
VNIILFGPPGAGKDTQSDNLAKDFSLYKISTGDLLREEVKKKSALGIKITSVIEQGLLVSDDIINDLIEAILSNKIYFNRLIFDGYPRNFNQLKYLNILIKKYDQKILCVLNLKVTEDVIIKRIIGRQVCSKCGLTFNEFFNPSTRENHRCNIKFLQKRSDDNEKTARNRFKTYTKETLPVLDYYKNENLLYEIDGTAHIHEIYKEIRRIIHSLET